MTNVKQQHAARSLDRYCHEIGISAYIGLAQEGGLVVYARNRKALRKGTKLLPKKWEEYDVTIQSYSKSNAAKSS